jgi:hypothetical protein
MEIPSDSGRIRASSSKSATVGGGAPGTFRTRMGDHHRLDWRKTWASGGRHLTHLLVLTQDTDGSVAVTAPNHAPG